MAGNDPTVSGVFDLIDTLVVQLEDPLKALQPKAGRVTDGLDTSQGYGNVLMVGIDDEYLLGAANSAQSVQTMPTASTQHPRDENGTLTLLALAYDGGGRTKVARDAAKAMAGVVAGLVRDDPSLGLTTAPSVYPYFYVEFGSTFQLKQNQIVDVGAEAALVFSLSFQTVVRPS